MNNQMIYNGQCQQGLGESLHILNPATLALLTTCRAASSAQVDEAVQCAQRAFEQWQYVSDEQVKTCLEHIANDLLAEREHIAELICLEQGKPLGLALVEVDMAIYWLKATNALQIPVLKSQDESGRTMTTYHRPVGVVASITPWNWPFVIAVWHLIPALKAKNCVVNKPSEYTPLSTIYLVEIINRHLPAAVCNVVLGDKATGTALVQHHDVNKITFTGSATVGCSILSKAALTLKPVILELGGNDAAIVLEDVSVSEVALNIFMGSFLNAGQTCACIKRLYVHERIYDELLEALVTLAEQQIVGNGLDPFTTMGPIQNIKQYQKLKTMISNALAEGAVVANKTVMQLPEQGYFIAPLILTELSPDSEIFASEQFGPVLPIIRFHDIEQVIQQANCSSYGLGGSIWSSDIQRAEKLAARLQVGTVWINRHAEVSPHAVFGGWKMSGLGYSFALEGLLQYTKKQVIHAA